MALPGASSPTEPSRCLPHASLSAAPSGTAPHGTPEPANDISRKRSGCEHQMRYVNLNMFADRRLLVKVRAGHPAVADDAARVDGAQLGRYCGRAKT
jgi:hypothetical protein